MRSAAHPARLVKTSFFLPEELLWAAKAMAAGDQLSLRAWLTRLVETERARRHAKRRTA
jgi:hypothetical protein